MDKRTTQNDLETIPLPLPESRMPKEWWDDDGISYFFSPFRSHNQNPSDRDNKIQFWKPLIRDWCEYNNRCTFVLLDLERIFRRNQLVPACLGGVIDDLLRNRQITTKDDFLRLPPQTWTGWAVDVLIRKPAGWSFKKAKELIKTPKMEEQVYVHLEALKLQGNQLLITVRGSGQGSLMSKRDIQKLVPLLKDLDVILHWLMCQDKITTRVHKDEELIKFSCSEENVTAISETDVGIYALQKTEKTLLKHIEELESEKLVTVEAAKSYIKKGMKQMAKNSLRKKQELEKCLAKRSSILENVQILLSRIQESHSDAKVLETYQQGLSALKFTMKEANLTDVTVENTMLQISEVLDIQDEIQESMANHIASTDEQELEIELAQLLISDESSPEVQRNITQAIDTDGPSSERMAVKREKLFEDLPKVPQELPSLPKKQVSETSS